MASSPVTSSTPSGLSPERRTILFYLVLFMTAGAANAYGGIWFEARGLSASQISVINALPVFIMLTVNLVVGRMSDRASDWRQAIVIGALGAGLFPLGLFLGQGFWITLTFWTLAAVCHMAIIPVLDAAAMRMTARRGTDFGSMRAWGTIGYLLIIVGTGYLVSWLGPGAFLPFFVVLALLRAGMSLQLPRFRAAPGEAAPMMGARTMRQVMKPWFLLPLFGFAMIFGSHLILNAFQGLLWERQGIPLPTIGLLIALGGVSETLMFFGFRRLDGRWPARTMVLFSAIVTVLRWIVMAFAPGVPVLIALQSLHGITYGLGFMACINFIKNHTAEDIAAEAQSFFVVLQQGMAVVALLGFGQLVDLLGPRAYLASAVFAAAGAVCIWASLRLKPPEAD